MTQRNKNILLLLGFVLLSVLSYRLAISRTLFLKREVAKMESQNLDLGKMASLSATLAQRERFTDSVLRQHNLKNTSVQNNLLEFLNRESDRNGFSIEEFLEPHISLRDGATVTSYQFRVQGEYRDLEKVVHSLEQQFSFGEIIHLSLERKKDYRRGKNYLECFVVMESFTAD